MYLKSPNPKFPLEPEIELFTGSMIFECLFLVICTELKMWYYYASHFGICHPVLGRSFPIFSRPILRFLLYEARGMQFLLLNKANVDAVVGLSSDAPAY